MAHYCIVWTYQPKIAYTYLSSANRKGKSMTLHKNDCYIKRENFPLHFRRLDFLSCQGKRLEKSFIVVLKT